MGREDRDSKRSDRSGANDGVKEHVKMMLRKLSARPKHPLNQGSIK